MIRQKRLYQACSNVYCSCIPNDNAFRNAWWQEASANFMLQHELLSLIRISYAFVNFGSEDLSPNNIIALAMPIIQFNNLNSELNHTHTIKSITKPILGVLALFRPDINFSHTCLESSSLLIFINKIYKLFPFYLCNAQRNRIYCMPTR